MGEVVLFYILQNITEKRKAQIWVKFTGQLHNQKQKLPTRNTKQPSINKQLFFFFGLKTKAISSQIKKLESIYINSFYDFVILKLNSTIIILT